MPASTQTKLQPAAFFDVDRTLLPGRTMERIFLGFLIKRGYVGARDLARFLRHAAQSLGRSPGCALRANKQHLKDKNARELERLAAECFADHISPVLSLAGRRAVLDHRRAGHMVVLLTGSLHPLAEELRRELGADLALAARLEENAGSLSGALANQRPYGHEKARLVRRLAGEKGLDLSLSFAYGDHRSDVAVLEAVGNPRAVNPDRGLASQARSRGWPILNF